MWPRDLPSVDDELYVLCRELNDFASLRYTVTDENTSDNPIS